MSFTAQLKRFEKVAAENTEQAARGTALSLWRAVILDSPVDTGRFRGNWFASDTTPSDKVSLSVADKTGAKAVAAATNETLTANDWQSLWLSNNLPYAERLENGWSQQSPSGMVKVNVARFQSIVDAQARKVNK